MAELTLFYAGDVHGSERCFLRFVNAARFYGVRTLVLGGDITGKVLVPIVRQGLTWRCEFLGRQECLRTEAEVAKMERRIRMSGQYPYVCDVDDFQRLMADEGYRRHVFERVMRAAVERWLELAEERLEGAGVRCCIMPGNDDGFFVDEALEGSRVVVNHDGCAVWLDDRFQMLGCSWSNPTPWRSPREEPPGGGAGAAPRPGRGHGRGAARAPEPQLPRAPARERARPGPRAARGPLRLPRGRRAPDGAGREHGRPPAHREDAAGAVAARARARVAGDRQAEASLCVNPGSDYAGGVLKGCLVTLRPGQVLGFQLVEG